MPQRPFAWTDHRKTELPTKRTLLKAYNAEAEALQALHVRMSKQLKRLELEEQMLLKILVTARDKLPADSHLLAEEPEELRGVIAGVEPFTSGPLAAAASPSGRQAEQPGDRDSEYESEEEPRDGSDAPDAAAEAGPSKRQRTGDAPGLYEESNDESSDREWEDVAAVEAAPTSMRTAAQPGALGTRGAAAATTGTPKRRGRRRQARAEESGEEELSSGDEGRETLEVDAPWE